MTCSRCIRGFMFPERDEDGPYRKCLQCGHRVYVDPKPVLDIPGRQSLEVKEFRRRQYGPKTAGIRI